LVIQRTLAQIDASDKGISYEKIKRLGFSLKQLQRGLTGTRALAGKSYLSEKESMDAYLLYYWPISFVQVFSALSEIHARKALPPLERMLDLGAGPGSATFAAAFHGAKSSILTDISEVALAMAQRLASAVNSLKIETARLDLGSEAAIPKGPFDLIVASHSMNELWKSDTHALEKRTRLVSKVAKELSANGILLIVEPSATATSIPALMLRDNLIASLSEPLLECIAPCPKSCACPVLSAGQGRTCHSTWKWNPPDLVAELAREAGLDRDSVKATWFALRRRQDNATQNNATQNIPTMHEESQLEGRIISEPMLNKAGRLRYIVCEGQSLATFSARADSPHAEKSGFLQLKRGDLINASNVAKREGDRSFGLEIGSKLHIAYTAPRV
jgi:ribosomal protein RSM22 (predicted rRNA methylase)